MERREGSAANMHVSESMRENTVNKGKRENGHEEPANGQSYHEQTYGTFGVHDPNAPRYESGFRNWFAVKPNQ